MVGTNQSFDFVSVPVWSFVFGWDYVYGQHNINAVSMVSRMACVSFESVVASTDTSSIGLLLLAILLWVL